MLALFNKPAEFLLQTIQGLSTDFRAAIALIFLSGGKIRSPVENSHELKIATEMFGVTSASIREALTALNGSLLLLAHDEQGRYWTYKHPTTSDAFAKLVAVDSELVEIYLRGAKSEWITQEVVCSGVSLYGASVTVPPFLYPLLYEKIKDEHDYKLVGFLSYRADRAFVELVLNARPELLDRLKNFLSPISEDADASFLARLYELQMLPEDIRQNFVNIAHNAAITEVDASFFSDSSLKEVFTDEEIAMILGDVESQVFTSIPDHVERLKNKWDNDYSPHDYFDEFQDSLKVFIKASHSAHPSVMKFAEQKIDAAIQAMEYEYEEPKKVTNAPLPKSIVESSIEQMFSDIDQ